MNENDYLIPIIHFDEVVMTQGKGSYVFDSEKKRYLDLNSGQFCTVLGHCNDVIVDSISSQMRKLSHTSSAMLSDEVLKCAKNLHRISGDLKASSILLSTGAEAVEFCIRYAKAMQKKDGIICFDKGYHGLTLGAQSVTFAGKFAAPTVSKIFSVPIPNEAISPNELDQYIQNFRKMVESHYFEIAAALFEPIVSVGGMIYPPQCWFKEIRQICDEYDILLIFDECQTGFGRTGNWFMYQTLDVLPDMVALAKGIGLGYPVSAAMFSEKLIIKNKISITHYSSHQNDSFAASVINTGIDYIESNKLLQMIKEKGDYFLQALKTLSQNCEFVKAPRGRGLMLGLDLNFDGVSNYRKIYAEIYKCMMYNNVIIQGTNGGKTLRFLPDYLITKEDIDFAIERLEKVILQKDWSSYEV